MANEFVYKFPDDDEENRILDELVFNVLDSKDDKEKEEELEFDINNHPNIYHYTSPMGLKEIITDNSLWFTHYKFLNDRSEKYYCYDLFKRCIEREKGELKKVFYSTILSVISENGDLNYEIFNKKTKDLPDYYIASFSLNNNSLSMWNYYTKTINKTGYNISFKTKELINSLKNKSYNYYKVNYDIKRQTNEIERYIRCFNNAWDDTKSEAFLQWLQYLLLDLIDLISLRFKHHAFANEEEFRIVYKVTSLNSEIIEKEKLLEFRESNGIIVPYLNIGFNKTSIEGIKISPMQQDELVKEGLLMMLNNMGYHHFEKKDITTSDIPLRN